MRQTIRRDSPNRQHVTLATAFDYFNRRLFDGVLPPAFINHQRQAGSRGYYSGGRFERRGRSRSDMDEIAMNPEAFAGRSDRAILSTLVHEMVHHWQRHFGTSGRGRYHNQEWADKMAEIGLVASDTGRRGGRRVGDRMTHYIAPEGRFAVACRELLADGIRLEWQSHELTDARTRRSRAISSKTKYTCPLCGLNAWAKPGVFLVCGTGRVRMLAAGEARVVEHLQ